MNRYVQYYIIDGFYPKYEKTFDGPEFNYMFEDNIWCIYLDIEEKDE